MADTQDRKVLHVDVVTVVQREWEGEAILVRARTLNGDIGIMPGHAPLLGLMDHGSLLIRTPDGEDITAETEGGYFSVDNNKVTVICNHVQFTDGSH
ncbi:MAG: F0F1 ATP synthase subunit epsilon [Micrococcaceae bacterium]